MEDLEIDMILSIKLQNIDLETTANGTDEHEVRPLLSVFSISLIGCKE